MTPAPHVEEFDKDELAARDWLNVGLFTNVLRQHEKDESITVKAVNFKAAAAQTDHYASVMFRATVDYEQQGQHKSKSFIVKTMPELEGHKRDILGNSKIFETEIGMYTEVLEKFEQTLREVGDYTQLKASCLYYGLSPKKFIIFEDLVPLGYEVLRSRKPNIMESKAALLKLAKLHAISYKMILENPVYFDEYRYGTFTVSGFVKNEFTTGGLDCFIKTLSSHAEFEQYVPCFEAMRRDFLQKCIDSFKEYRDAPREGAPYVLCHGDFHNKNMMFKNSQETGKFEDVMLLDYQLSYVGPMVLDVIYATYMLFDADLRLNHLDELIYYYFSNFVATLRKIGFEGRVPTMIEFRQQLTQHKHFELFLLFSFLPIWYAFSDGTTNPEELVTKPEMQHKLYEHKEYLKELRVLLPRYLHKGYLEI